MDKDKSEVFKSFTNKAIKALSGEKGQKIPHITYSELG